MLKVSRVHGKVELEAYSTLQLILSQKETDRINLEISSQHGVIYRQPKVHRGQKRTYLPTLKAEKLKRRTKENRQDSRAVPS